MAEAAIAASATLSLPRSAPEAQGVSSAGLLALVDALDQQIEECIASCCLRHGQVVAEGWWTPFEAAANTNCIP